MPAVLVLTPNLTSADTTATKARPLIVRFDGDYADVWPLFKFRKVANAPAYIKASEFRTKYAALAQASPYGRDTNVIIPASKPKRLLYHYGMIKMLLLSLDLLELEYPFAAHWDMDELPMLDQYQFDYWDIHLTVYNKNMTPRPSKIVRLFQRRCDQWFNLTAAAAEHDGDESGGARHLSIAAQNNHPLFERLEALDISPPIKTLDDPKDVKKLSAAEKKAIANKYVDTTWSKHETWCHPIVFNDTMSSLFWDWRMKSSNSFIDTAPVVARREILKAPAFDDVEYFPRGRPLVETTPESEDEDDVVGPV